MTTTEEAAIHAWQGPHGHVNPREDGLRAKCSGLDGCAVCQQEMAESMAALRQATEVARTNQPAEPVVPQMSPGEVFDSAALRTRIPVDALERAAAEGPLTREEKLGDICADRREMLRVNRLRFWAAILRAWPDDDFTRAGLDCLEAGQQPRRIIEWMQDPEAKILILTGQTGRGKTYAQFAIGNAYAGTGRYVYAISHKRYLDSLEPDGSDEPDWLIRRRAANAEVLLIDGFGDELNPEQPASEFRLRETADLISTRLGKGKRTIISTNLKSAQLALMFGDRIISRLKWGSTALLVQGEDRRAVGATW